MIRVQFNNQISRHVCEFESVSSEVVQLTGEKVPRNTSGFQVFKMNGEFLGDYSEFTEIVGETENGFLFGKRE